MTLAELLYSCSLTYIHTYCATILTTYINNAVDVGSLWSGARAFKAVFSRSYNAVEKHLSYDVSSYIVMKISKLAVEAGCLHGLVYALVQTKSEVDFQLICVLQWGSRSLNSAECNYSTIELECLGIQWALKKCNNFLRGLHDFDVLTDHRPLIGLFAKTLNLINNPWLMRPRPPMPLRSSGYQARTTWSWTPLAATLPAPHHCWRLPQWCLAMWPSSTGWNQRLLLAPSTARSAMHSSPTRTPIAFRTTILQGSFLRFGTTSPTLEMAFFAWHQAAFRASLMPSGSAGNPPRLAPWHHAYVPHHPQPLLLAWPQKQCICHRQQVQPLPVLPGQSQTLCTSHNGGLGPHGADLSRLVPDQQCALSRPRWLLLGVPLGLEAVLIVLQGRYRAPYVVVPPLWISIRTDGGPQFREEFCDFCSLHSIMHKLASPYHPWGNGAAEVAMKAMKALLTKTRPSNFEASLSIWRSTCSTSSVSPGSRFFGRTLHTTILILAMQQPLTPQPGRDVWKDKLRPLAIGSCVRVQDPRTYEWTAKGIITATDPILQMYHVCLDTVLKEKDASMQR